MKRVNINGTSVSILGDQHLGRRFVNGVPFHRRGEREAQQWETFQRSLFDVEGVELHVNMGDVFDKYTVPPEVVLKVANLYIDAAERYSDVQFVVLRGNHDASRDGGKASSFDLFSALVGYLRNVTVATAQTELEINGNWFGFCGWCPFSSAKDVVDYLGTRRAYSAVFGHWDIESYGSDDTHNLLPYEELAKITNHVFTGHVHKAQEFERDGLHVTVTGSMMPYAHGEDDGETYVTLTPAEIEGKDLRDKCVRVLLQEGEEMPEGIDALQVTYKRVVDGETETVEIGEVEIAAFNMKTLFHDVMREVGVEEEPLAEAWAAYERLREESIDA